MECVTPSALFWLLLMNYFNFERRKNTCRTECRVIIMILSDQQDASFLYVKDGGVFRGLQCSKFVT